MAATRPYPARFVKEQVPGGLSETGLIALDTPIAAALERSRHRRWQAENWLSPSRWALILVVLASSRKPRPGRSRIGLPDPLAGCPAEYRPRRIADVFQPTIDTKLNLLRYGYEPMSGPRGLPVWQH
jgi:hypothetical protein